MSAWPKWLRYANWRHRDMGLWWHGGIQFVVSRFGDGLNLFVGLFLIPQYIPAADLGAIVPLLRLVAFAALPVALVVDVGARYSSVFDAGGQKGRVKALLLHGLVAAAITAVLALLALLIMQRGVMLRVRVTDPYVVWIIGAMVVVWPLVTILMSTTSGLLQFGRINAVAGLNPVFRFVCIVVLLPVLGLGLNGYLLASLLANVGVLAILVMGVRHVLHRDIAPVSYDEFHGEMRTYLLRVSVLQIALQLMQTVEAFVIRNFTPVCDSAGFFIADTIGQVPTGLAGALAPFLLPIVARRHDAGHIDTVLLRRCSLLMFVPGVAMAAVLYLTAGPLLGLWGGWAPYVGYADIVWQIVLVHTCHTVVLTYTTFQNGRNDFRYLPGLVVLMVAEAVGLYIAMGWPFFYGKLPDPLWHAVNAVVVRRVDFVVGVMLLTRICALAHVLWSGRYLYSRRGEVTQSTGHGSPAAT